MSVYKNCVNCGKQNLADEETKPTDKCISCGKPIGIKEGKSAEPTPAEKHKDEPSESVQATQPQEAPQEEQPAPLYEGKPHKYRRGIRKWGKICKECESHYLHDEITWCSSKRCPKRCPPALRPQYRPKDIVKPAEEKPITPKPKKVKKAKETPIIPGKAPETLEEADEVCANCPVVQSFKGYRLAVKDILGSSQKVMRRLFR